MDDIWIKHKETIKHLYQDEDKPRWEVKKVMETQHGFPETSLSQYEVKLRDVLGLRKKLKKEDWPRIYTYAQARGYRAFDVRLGDTIIPWKKAWKEIRRSGAHRISPETCRRPGHLPTNVRLEEVSSDQNHGQAQNRATQKSSSHGLKMLTATLVIKDPHLELQRIPSRVHSYSLQDAQESCDRSALQHGGTLMFSGSIPGSSSSAITQEESVIHPMSQMIAEFAKSRLDSLPWHQYRIDSYGRLLSGRKVQPTVSENGGYMMVLMPADRFFRHTLGCLATRISDSCYPTSADLREPWDYLSSLSSNLDVYHFLAIMVYRVSNNYSDDFDDMIQILHRRVPRSIVFTFFRSGLCSARAVWVALYNRLPWADHLADAFIGLLEVLFDARPTWIMDVRDELLTEIALVGNIPLTKRLLATGARLKHHHMTRYPTMFDIVQHAGQNYAEFLAHHIDTKAQLFPLLCRYAHGDPIDPHVPYCTRRHLHPEALMTHFTSFINDALFNLDWPLSTYEGVLLRFLDLGANVDSVFFNSFTLASYLHGQLVDVPKEWMPTCLDMCFYWNRPLFHYLLPHSARTGDELTGAGVCAAALGGRQSLACYLDARSAYSASQKRRYLEVVLIEQFYPIVSFEYGDTPSLPNTDIIRALVEFGVSVQPIPAGFTSSIPGVR